MNAPPPMLRRNARHHRPPRVVRLVGVAVGLSLVAVGVVSMARSDPHPRVRTAGLGPFVPPATEPSPSTEPLSRNVSPRWEAFARARGVTLYLPARDPVAVTYHEASFHDALALHPLGHVVRNANRWKFDSPPRTTGPGYIVMSSRGRSTPATSAADVVLRPTTPFLSPVTGRVIRIEPYHLYCRYPDLRVSIRPEGSRHLSVVMIHLRGVRVQPGDPVFATLSVIGYARVFPFRSQVDDYVRGGNPHVHIEITKPHKARPATC